MQAESPIVWQLPPKPLLLDEGQIHVWKLAFHPADDQDPSLLDQHERTRHDAMAGPQGQARFVAIRGALRKVLAAYLDTAPGKIRFKVARGGKPAIPGGPEFNLSHGGELALLAVSARPVGIDVEPLRNVPRRLAIARRVLGDVIAQQLARLPVIEQDRAFLMCWTAMEARQKCHGEGVFGRRIDTAAVGSLGFQPDEHHLAHLAWRDPLELPEIRFFAQSAS